MTRGELVTAILGTRFRDAQLANARRWLDQRYRQVWVARDDWAFKYAIDDAVTVTAGSRTLTGADGLVGKVLGLRNQDGWPLEPLAPERWYDVFEGDTTISEPSHFTIVDGTIKLGPTPSVSRTFSLSYKRRLCHYQTGRVTLAAGLMNEDSDEPVWDTAFHDLLVQGSMATGLKERNDPTWPSLEEEFDRMLREMGDELRADLGGRRRSYQPDPHSRSH